MQRGRVANRGLKMKITKKPRLLEQVLAAHFILPKMFRVCSDIFIPQKAMDGSDAAL